jgi:hypothetical protein
MPTPKREFQDRSDHGPIEDAGRPTYQTARTTVAADFVFDPFPPPREYMPALPHDAEPGQLAPCSGDVRPRGPDLAKVAEIAAAIMKRNTERRASWRQENLALSSEDEQQRDLLEGNGRVRVASPAAFQKYLKRGFGLIETYRHEINMRASREDVDPRSFANWVAARRPLLKPGTWRVYRQAAIAVILTIPSAYIDEAIGMLNEDLQVGADKGRHTAGPHASDDQQAIAKFMKFDHFQRLKQRLREMGTSEVCLALLDRMDASVSTGLRIGVHRKTRRPSLPTRRAHLVARGGGESGGAAGHLSLPGYFQIWRRDPESGRKNSPTISRLGLIRPVGNVAERDLKAILQYV